MAAVDDRTRAETGPPLAIPQEQQRLLAAMDRYVQEGPESPELVAIKYRRANLLYGYHHYRDAAPLFQDIAENHPTNDHMGREGGCRDRSFGPGGLSVLPQAMELRFQIEPGRLRGEQR